MMIESIIFQAIAPFLINPALPDKEAPYKSGVQEVGNSYLTDKPATDYPMLTLEYMAHDGEFNTVKPGIYAVDLMLETRQLLIMERGQIIAKCPVVQLIELEDELKAAVPKVVVGYIKDNKIFIVYKNENIEAHGVLYKTSELPGF